MKFEVNKLLSHFWTQACVEKSYCKNWELFKFEISKYFRRYSSVIAKSRRAEEDQVVVKIASLSQRSPDSLSEEERMELVELQSKLDDIYSLKAKGAFNRSRNKWLEEGEQNSYNFFKLEKSQSINNTIHKLNIDGIITDDQKIIANY